MDNERTDCIIRMSLLVVLVFVLRDDFPCWATNDTIDLRNFEAFIKYFDIIIKQANTATEATIGRMVLLIAAFKLLISRKAVDIRIIVSLYCVEYTGYRSVTVKIRSGE